MKGQMESAVKDYDSSVPRMKAKLPAMKEVRDKKAKKVGARRPSFFFSAIELARVASPASHTRHPHRTSSSPRTRRGARRKKKTPRRPRRRRGRRVLPCPPPSTRRVVSAQAEDKKRADEKARKEKKAIQEKADAEKKKIAGGGASWSPLTGLF